MGSLPEECLPRLDRNWPQAEICQCQDSGCEEDEGVDEDNGGYDDDDIDDGNDDDLDVDGCEGYDDTDDC